MPIWNISVDFRESKLTLTWSRKIRKCLAKHKTVFPNSPRVKSTLRQQSLLLFYETVRHTIAYTGIGFKMTYSIHTERQIKSEETHSKVTVGRIVTA